MGSLLMQAVGNSFSAVIEPFLLAWYDTTSLSLGPTLFRMLEDDGEDMYRAVGYGLMVRLLSGLGLDE